MVLVFDNKYSKLRSKTVAYFTGTEKPPVFVESPNVGAVKDPLPAAGVLLIRYHIIACLRGNCSSCIHARGEMGSPAMGPGIGASYII